MMEIVEYSEQYYNCEGICINDFDADGTCDELEEYSDVLTKYFVTTIQKQQKMMELCESSSVWWYLDADGDGFGNQIDSALFCDNFGEIPK